MQGLLDEFESATIAVAALTDALEHATPFERPALHRSLREATAAKFDLALELLTATATTLNQVDRRRAA